MTILEIEIKAYCENLDQTIAKVKQLGGQYLKEQKEEDLYLNHPGRDFKKTDEALRIRTIGDQSILTYKGPKISQKSKARIESETELVNQKEMLSIFQYLGYEIAGRVEKNRIYYQLEGIEVCCDQVAQLGNFIELEKKGHELKKIESELILLAETLGLDRFEKRSYLELLLERS